MATDGAAGWMGLAPEARRTSVSTRVLYWLRCSVTCFAPLAGAGRPDGAARQADGRGDAAA